ncbi:MAG: PilZ domain-containing protein [Gammaproteobacteria bacterium]|nr:PilZ domain-containing protein [Gammaproteobacteria bacterium]
MTDNSRGILSLSIQDKPSLEAAFMPFVKNGGVFVPTKKVYKLGEDVFMLLTLIDDKERIPIAGRVVWITPQGAQGNRTPGIGMQFNDQDHGATRNRIEGLLAGTAQSDSVGQMM